MDPQAIVEHFRKAITEHCFDVNGRVSRSDFWYFMLGCFVVALAAGIVDSVLGFWSLFSAIVGLGLLLSITGMGARRLQDIGRPGNHMCAIGIVASLGWLIGLWSLVASIAMIFIWIQLGNAGANQFGAEPKAAIA